MFCSAKCLPDDNISIAFRSSQYAVETTHRVTKTREGGTAYAIDRGTPLGMAPRSFSWHIPSAACAVRISNETVSNKRQRRGYRQRPQNRKNKHIMIRNVHTLTSFSLGRGRQKYYITDWQHPTHTASWLLPPTVRVLRTGRRAHLGSIAESQITNPLGIFPDSVRFSAVRVFPCAHSRTSDFSTRGLGNDNRHFQVYPLGAGG